MHPYRTIIFVDRSAHVHGYPMPHLSGRTLIRGETGGGAQKPPPDKIVLYFSSGTVEVTGTHLAALWEKLVCGGMDSPTANQMTVRVGDFRAAIGEKDGKCCVSEIGFK